jgi:hypothetical protein
MILPPNGICDVVYAPLSMAHGCCCRSQKTNTKNNGKEDRRNRIGKRMSQVHLTKDGIKEQADPRR